MEINELKGHFDAASNEIKSLLAKQADEIKRTGEASAETASAIKKADERISAIDAEIKGRLDKLEAAGNRPNLNGREEAKSIGAQFVESEEFKRYCGRGASDRFLVKDISAGSASAGALIPEFRVPRVFINPDRPLFLRQLVRNQPCSTDAVVIMRENVFTNAAGPQYDSDAPAPKNQLVAKNKSNITYAKETIPVETQAHYIVAARQILSDVPMLRGMIDQRLRYGLDLNIDAQLTYGTGTNSEFTGLFVDTDIPDIGEMTDVAPGGIAGAMIDHIRRAVTQCQLNEYYNINGLIMNPQDWELIETAKGDDGHYIWVTVPSGGEQRLWRVPVVVTNAVNQGDFLLGDWTMGATLYNREGMSIRLAEQHGNLFIENGVVILGEERNAFAIELPKAFTKGSFDVATA